MDGLSVLSVSVETSSRFQDVEAFEEVDSEGLPQEEKPRKSLEWLSVRHDVGIKVSNVLIATCLLKIN